VEADARPGNRRRLQDPIGKFGKGLVGVAATELGALVIEEAMKRAKASPKTSTR